MFPLLMTVKYISYEYPIAIQHDSCLGLKRCRSKEYQPDIIKNMPVLELFKKPKFFVEELRLKIRLVYEK